MIRITTGELKGFQISIPKSKSRRYTTAMMRKYLMDVIDVENANILEVFGGSGIVSFEFLSNGAKSSTIIEIDKRACKYIKINAQKLRLLEKINIINKDFRIALPDLVKKRVKYDIIFLDPPFERGFFKELEKFKSHLLALLQESGILIIEKSKKEKLFDLSPLSLTKSKVFSDMEILLFERVQ